MLTIVVPASVLALGYFVSWWFLLLFIPIGLKLPMLFRRAKALKVLKDEYGYEYPASAPQAKTLNMIERDTRQSKFSAEELATMFMTVMINSLPNPANQSETEEIRAFSKRVYMNASRLYMQQAISTDSFFQLQSVIENKLGAPIDRLFRDASEAHDEAGA